LYASTGRCEKTTANVFFAIPGDAADTATQEFNAATLVYIRPSEKSMKTAVPAVRIVELPGANLYVFLSNEEGVLREIRSFMIQ